MRKEDGGIAKALGLQLRGYVVGNCIIGLDGKAFFAKLGVYDAASVVDSKAYYTYPDWYCCA